jgi:hypothetical protein
VFKIAKPDTTNLDRAIDKAFADALNFPTNSEEHAAIMKTIDQLYVLRYPELKKEAKKQIDPNAIIGAGASLGAVLLVISAERVMVLSSKALGFALKAKL